MDEELLFTRNSLQFVLEDLRGYVRHEVRQWEPEQLLATTERDVIEYLVARYSITCPVLHRNQAEQLPVSEERRFSMASSYRSVTIQIIVPFDGDERVFWLRASRSSINPPRGRVQDGELRLTWTGDPKADAAATAIGRYFEEQLDSIEQYLSWSRDDIDQGNASLRTLASSLVTERKAQLLADRQLEAGVGFPVRQRADASQYSAPITRRKIETPSRPTASGPFQPEPFLPEAQYEQALTVLRNARNALERSPSVTSHLNEEKIRDLLLMFLNAQFEGAAAGEVFNAAGKTDILIRIDDRNIFIAECKIWNGPRTIRNALTQLLSYLTWRDTKAALLVFIRNGEPTAIIRKSIVEIEAHPNYKRASGTGEDDERHNFVLHANGDPDREIQLAFLPFAFQDTLDQPAKDQSTEAVP